MSTALDPASLPVSERSTARSAVSDTDERKTRHSGEIRKLTSLLDVSQALSSPINVKSAFHRVLEILERYHGTGTSVIALPREDGRRLHLHASVGMRAHHSDSPLGGSLAQQVFDSGRPVVIPRVSREPALADLQARTAERGGRGPRGAGRGIGAPDLEDERTYICVPVHQIDWRRYKQQDSERSPTCDLNILVASDRRVYANVQARRRSSARARDTK